LIKKIDKISSPAGYFFWKFEISKLQFFVIKHTWAFSRSLNHFRGHFVNFRGFGPFLVHFRGFFGKSRFSRFFEVENEPCAYSDKIGFKLIRHLNLTSLWPKNCQANIFPRLKNRSSKDFEIFSLGGSKRYYLSDISSP